MIMATFPKAEGDVIILANEMVGGLTTGTATYPEPPIEPTDLNMLNNTFKNAQNALTAAQAAVEQAGDVKLTALENLIDAMKKDIKYAETTVGNDDAKLKIIGWGARRTRRHRSRCRGRLWNWSPHRKGPAGWN